MEYKSIELRNGVTDEEEYITSRLESANGVGILAAIEGQLAGFIGFAGGGMSRIEHVGDFGCSVLKEYWGLGVGSALVGALIEWAKSSGIIRKLNLMVRVDNERGIRLYEKSGFVREGLISRQHYIDGRFYDCVFMGLQID